MKIISAFASLLLFHAVGLDAKHIIGGEIVYECVSPGVYNISMNLYRDCDSGGALYDTPGHFGIYQGSTLLRVEDILPQDQERIAEPTNPCVIFPSECVETATYHLNNVSLPVINETYTIAYQRCCRNESVTNIVTPGDVGATYFVEITPAAQQVCNNSPVFEDFPEIIICANELLDFNHGATDADGDSLVYSFCAPFIGGGMLGTNENPGNPNGPNGVQPNPPTAPPYNTVTFLPPFYSADEPMGGAPTISINSETGEIIGVPINLGQFVVGVCVQEYRNGVLIGQIRRGFQYNVVNCETTVRADIQEDTIISGGEFIINLCGDTATNIISQTQFGAGVTSRVNYWEVQLGPDSTLIVDDADTIFVEFPGLGSYSALLVANPENACRDTAHITINVYPDITTDFSVEYDACTADSVEFTSVTVAAAGQPIDYWSWDFDDGNRSGLENPKHLYTTPGNFDVALMVRDSNGCVDTSTHPLSYFPAPKDVEVDLTDFIGCAPEELFFKNLTFPIDSTYSISWDFGDGTTSHDINPTHLYLEAGTYEVTLEIVSPLGCETDEPFTATLELFVTPEAGFSFSPESVSNFNPDVFVFDESRNASAWLWDFGDGSRQVVAQDPGPHAYEESGIYQIMQVVRHTDGCLDTAYAEILSELLVTYHLPNAFSPNNDGVNEGFRGTGSTEGIRNFEMTIWNRWGERIFMTDNPAESWNGRKDNSGPLSPKGVYVVLVRYVEPGGKLVELKGFVTLLQ